MATSEVDLDEFFKIGPRLPDREGLVLHGFLSQQSASERDTGLHTSLVLAAERATNENLPVIFDITVAKPDIKTEPADWSKIRPILNVLRNLKNRIFENSLTVKCIEMFQS